MEQLDPSANPLHWQWTGKNKRFHGTWPLSLLACPPRGGLWYGTKWLPPKAGQFQPSCATGPAPCCEVGHGCCSAEAAPTVAAMTPPPPGPRAGQQGRYFGPVWCQRLQGSAVLRSAPTPAPPHRQVFFTVKVAEVFFLFFFQIVSLPHKRCPKRVNS